MDEFDFSALVHLAITNFYALSGVVMIAAALVVGDTGDIRYWAALTLAAGFYIALGWKHRAWKKKWASEIKEAGLD